MGLKLYYDLMSQPSRSLYILLKLSKCDFEPKLVDLRRGEHYTEEFKTVNRFPTVPVIDHNGYLLTESVAIVKYLAQEGIIPEKLYPKDSKKQARVNEYLAWQHLGLRLHCAMYFRVKYLNPILSGKELDPATVENYERRMVSAIETFSTKWLSNGTEFVSGDNITVADLFAATELEQPRMAGYDPAEKFEPIAVWREKVRQYFSPQYEEAHIILNKIVQKNLNAKAKL